MTALLLQPYKLREVELRNRVVLPPMSMYIAEDGMVNQFHLTHYQQFALGGMGLVVIEQTAVNRQGRITNGCLGIWHDDQIEGLAKLAAGIQYFGAKAALQISHSGRKGSTQRAWRGNGPLTAADIAAGEQCWQPVGPSDQPLAAGWLKPAAMSPQDLEDLCTDFVAATKRALQAGFDVLEIHMAHGYLLQSFLSPLANKRTDNYGGSLANRMRLPLRVVQQVRAIWPQAKPLLVRISASDLIDGGWELADSLILAEKLKALGVDLIDCSSGGNLAQGTTNSSLKRVPGYQVPFARQIRQQLDMPTMAVGMIYSATQAEEILQQGSADLIAIGRQALFNPAWALHAELELEQNLEFSSWPTAYGWWMRKWAPVARKHAAQSLIVPKA